MPLGGGRGRMRLHLTYNTITPQSQNENNGIIPGNSYLNDLLYSKLTASMLSLYYHHS